jgi:hypothetical protein
MDRQPSIDSEIEEMEETHVRWGTFTLRVICIALVIVVCVAAALGTEVDTKFFLLCEIVAGVAAFVFLVSFIDWKACRTSRVTYFGRRTGLISSKDPVGLRTDLMRSARTPL